MSLLTLNVIDTVSHILATPAIEDPGLQPITLDIIPPEEDYVKNELITDSLIANLKNLDENDFKLAHQKVLLTYRTHINKEAFMAWVGAGMGKPGRIIKPKFIRLAHESADPKNPYEHTHILIDFGKRFQSNNCRVFDWEDGNIHPNIKLVLTREHFDNAKAYLAKEDPENADLKVEKANFIAGILACNSKLEACEKFCSKNPNSAMGVSLIFDMKPPVRKIFTLETLFGWQQMAMNIMNSKEANDRTILWFYGRGNIGKSKFAKHIKCLNLNSESHDWALMTRTSSGDNVANYMLYQKDSGWTGKGLILDIPRKGETSNLYSPMEEIKNGDMTNFKFKAQDIELEYDSPCIMVMANFPPAVLKMSVDRWRVYKIVGKGESSAVVRRPLHRIIKRYAYKEFINLQEYFRKYSGKSIRADLKELMINDPREFDQDIINVIDTMRIREREEKQAFLRTIV